MKLSKKKVLSVVLVSILLGLYIAYRLGFADYFTLESIKTNSQYFADLVTKHYLISVICYMVSYFVIIAASIPSTAPMSMIGGFLFGVVPTIIFSTISATCGAIVSFLILRFFAKATIETAPAVSLPKVDKDKFQKFRAGMQEYGSFYLLFLHFTFLAPFFVINSLAVISGVSLWTFIWTTFIGFLPCAYVYALSGQKLLSIRSINEIFSWDVILIIIMLLIVVSLPMIISLFTRGKKNK